MQRCKRCSRLRLLRHRRLAITYDTHSMLCTRSMRLLAALVAVAAVTCPTSVFADWQEQSSSTQTGPVRLLLTNLQIAVYSLLFADRAQSQHVWCPFGHVVQECPSHYHWPTPNDRSCDRLGQSVKACHTPLT